MKGFKKLLTGILAATMVFSMGITAAATESTTPSTNLIINSGNETNKDSKAVITYDYYQILKADIVSAKQVAYYIEAKDSALATAVQNTGLFDVKLSADNSRYNVTLKNESTKAVDIAKALNVDAVKNAVVNKDQFESENGKASVKLEPGYYLVLSSLGTIAAVQTVGEVVTISEKNSYPTIEKKDDREFAQMFDTVVTYTVTVKIPQSAAEKSITVVDTATDGLTFDLAENAITATVEEKEIAKYTWSKPEEKDGKFVYKTEIPAKTVAGNLGKSIVLTYKATVNEKAVVLEKELNTAHLEYDNYASAETPEVDVTTLGVKIIKVDDTEAANPLTGAEFTLWGSEAGNDQIAVVKDEGTNFYRIAKEGEKGVNIVVDENGEALIVGLDATVYFLQEEKAPAGYNLLDHREKLTIEGQTQIKNHAVQEYKIVNSTGSVLPSTGGIGTTIFYILGSILIMAGVAYFLVRRKADAQA